MAVLAVVATGLLAWWPTLASHPRSLQLHAGPQRLAISPSQIPQPRAIVMLREDAGQEPSTNLLRLKRPLGARQISRGAQGWLGRETRWLAQQFLLFIEHETLGFVSVDEEEQLLGLLRERFGVAALRVHLQRRLQEAPIEAGPRLDEVDLPRARAGAEIASRHSPTVWAAFNVAVQNVLTKRAQSMEQGEVETGLAQPDWRDDIEWALLQRMGERTRGGPPMAPQAVAGKRRPTAREKPRIASSAAKSAPGAKVVGSGAPAKPQRAAKKDKAATSKAPKPRLAADCGEFA